MFLPDIALNALSKRADKKEFLSKLKKQKKENRGPLVVKLGRRMPEIPLY